MQVNVSSGVFGVDQVQVSTTAASPFVQEIIDTNVGTIKSILDRALNDPSSIQPKDFDDVIKALVNLKNLVVNGAKDDKGVTQRVTQAQAEFLDIVFKEFAKYGVTPSVSMLSIDDSYKIGTLTNIAKTDQTTGHILTDSLRMLTVKEAVNLNATIYTMMFDEVFPVIAKEFTELHDATATNDKVISSLNVLRDVASQTTTVPKWGFDNADAENLSSAKPSSGSIPPESVDELAAYLDKITSPKTWSVVSGRFDEDGMAIYENVSGGEYFKGLYAQDYAAAQGAVARDNPDNPNARNDPALVKAEMQRKDDKGNPIYHNSADFYHDVIYADGGKYPQRVTETLNIIGKSQVSEVGTKPNTNAQAGQDLREAKVALGGTDGKGGVIQELKTQGGDPELIKSLDALYKELDRLDKQTAADGKAQGKTQDQIDKDFAEAWIESYNKPPAGGGKTNKSNLETSQTIAQNINMDQTQDLKMLLAQLDMIMKAVTSAIKSIDETLRKLSGNLRI